MNPQTGVVCFGEIIADGFPMNLTSRERESETAFDFRLGGAPVNTAAGLALLGEQSSVICKIGNDALGISFKQKLKKLGVDVSRILTDPDRMTTQSLVTLSESGDRDFLFKPGAHDHILYRDVRLPAARIFHFGSLLQIRQSAYRTTIKLLADAYLQGSTISYDPNYRENLWRNRKRAKAVILETLPFINILKVSAEEAELLTGISSPETAAKILMRDATEIVIITRADKGLYYRSRRNSGFLPTIPVRAIDTTGAGDAFNAGFLRSLLQTKKSVSQLKDEEIRAYLRFGLVTGSLTTTKLGAIDAFPTHEQISRYASFINTGVL